MQSTVIGGAMLPHAPQFFTMPETEDKALVAHVREVAAGADVSARDPEHDNTPAGWAEVSIEVTNNPNCKDVAEYLAGVERRTAP